MQQPNNAKETSGTPGYMAPEVLFGKNHTTVVDYFACGAMCYEFMKGVKPYRGKNRKEIKEKIKEKEIKLDKKDLNEGWSLEAADFINQMLQRQAVRRLGYKGGISEVKNILGLKILIGKIYIIKYLFHLLFLMEKKIMNINSAQR